MSNDHVNRELVTIGAHQEKFPAVDHLAQVAHDETTSVRVQTFVVFFASMLRDSSSFWIRKDPGLKKILHP